MEKLVPMRPQRGFILFTTLIILVVITISAMAMMSIMNAGTSAAGNIAFRQASLRVADAGVNAARVWLNNTSNTNALVMNSDSLANGYYAYLTYTNGVEDFSPARFDWKNGAVKYYDPYGGGATALFSGGYEVYYVIHRVARPSDMAAAVNGGGACALTSTGCAAPPSASGAVSGQGQSQATGSNYNAGIQAKPGLVYYRVTVKVIGAKRNTSYVQAFLH